MLIIKIKQGKFEGVEPDGKVVNTHFRDVLSPMGSLEYDSGVVATLPPIEEYYQEAVRRGWSNDKIINALLFYYHRFRYFRTGYLANREITLGFIGHRGSGKSVSATAVAVVDFLLAGYTVWSNMPIKVIVSYGNHWKVFEAEPLKKLKMLRKDESFRNGVVVLDEVNVSIMDATMYMSKTNREASNFLQQLRKRGLSVIWTSQNWISVDPRLRWQTDYCVWNEDAYLRSPGIASFIGEVSKWIVMDSSGLSGNISMEEELQTKFLFDKVVWTGMFHSRFWWNAYNTYETQGHEEYSMKVLEKESQFEDVEYVLPEEDAVTKLMAKVKADGRDKIYKGDFWAENGITDKSMQSIIGRRMISDGGYVSKRDQYGQRRYYWQRVNKEVLING